MPFYWYLNESFFQSLVVGFTSFPPGGWSNLILQDCKLIMIVKVILLSEPILFIFICKRISINLTTVSKNTYVTGFLGSFQTPNPHIPPYSEYVIQRIIKINSKSMQPITKLGTINALRGLKRPQKTVVRLNIRKTNFLLKYIVYFHGASSCRSDFNFSKGI